MPLVKLSAKSQIVLPAKIRKKLALKPGDLLRINEKDNQIIIHKSPVSYVDSLEGCASDIWRGYEAELHLSREQWDN